MSGRWVPRARPWGVLARGGLLAAGLAVAVLVSGCTAGRVGLVETRRLLAESALALRYQRELDERERAMTTDLQLLARQLPREDLEARRAQYIRELQALRLQLEEDLNRAIRDVIQQIVREKRLRGVIVKGPVIYSQPGATVDITQEVIDRLK
ncbi:MAG: OmpH family outer membrane protein [Firmicutes bacterium]|nr:OmpH family outer membrane protein [Bacillota bacterium]